MPGQIIQREERTWLVRVYVGRDQQTGKRKYEGHTVHGAKKDAQTYLNGTLRERDLGTFTNVNHTVMAVLFNDVLNDYQINGKDYEWAEPWYACPSAAVFRSDEGR